MKQSLDVDDVQRRMLDELQSPGLFEHAKQHAVAYLAGVRARAVAPTPAAVAKLSALDEPMPDAPAGGDDILRELAELGGPATVAQLGGRYFGFVNGGAVPAALACRWLTDSWDQNAALSIMSPIASHLEAVCERWLVDLLRLPIESVAGFVSGSSVATLAGSRPGATVCCSIVAGTLARRDCSVRRPCAWLQANRHMPPCSRRCRCSVWAANGLNSWRQTRRDGSSRSGCRCSMSVAS